MKRTDWRIDLRREAAAFARSYFEARLSAASDCELAADYLDMLEGRLRREQAIAGGRRGGQTAGNGRKQDDANATDIELCAAVTVMHERNPRLAWSTVCERVGARCVPPKDRTTVAKRATAADWRTEKSRA